MNPSEPAVAPARAAAELPASAAAELPAPAAAVTPEAALRTRISGLDGPRGLACAAVLVLHVNAHYTPSVMSDYKLQLLGQALLFFFALSGFLLYLPYLRSMFTDPAVARVPATKTYALHRILRVFPVYLVIFAIASYGLRAVYTTNAAVEPPGSDSGTGTMTDPLQILANVTLLQSYVPSYIQTGINPAWSLSLELVFYASLPLFGALGLALRRRTELGPLVVGLVAPITLLALGTVGKTLAPLVQRAVGVYDPLLSEWGPNWLAIFNRSFISLADTFTFGMIAAVAFVATTTGTLSTRGMQRMRWCCGALLLPALAISVALLALHSRFSTTAVSLSSGMVVLFIVAPMAYGAKSTLARGLDWPPLRYVGKVSLSIYLWHYPVMLVLGRFISMSSNSVLGMIGDVAVVFGVSVAAAAVSYHVVERPAMTWAKRFR